MDLGAQTLQELMQLRGKLLRKMARTPRPSDEDREELRELDRWIDQRIKEMKDRPGGS